MSESSSTVEQIVADLDSSATWSVKYLDPTGFECLLSIEASTGVDALKKAQRALERLLESQCKPVAHKNIDPTLDEKKQRDESICPVHHVVMKKWEKNGRKWFAHKTNDGLWCKGVDHGS